MTYESYIDFGWTYEIYAFKVNPLKKQNKLFNQMVLTQHISSLEFSGISFIMHVKINQTFPVEKIYQKTFYKYFN